MAKSALRALEVATDGEPATAKRLSGGPNTGEAWTGPISDHGALFLQSAAQNGVQAFSVRKSFRQVLETASRRSPWITYIERDPELCGWVVLREKWGDKVRVVVCGEQTRTLTVSTERLMEAMGVALKEDSQEWIGVESRHSHADTPGEPPPARHGGGGDDGHGHSDAHDEHPSPMDRIRALFAEERSNLWIIVIYSIAIGLLSLVIPIAVQALVSTIAFGTVLQPLVVLTVVVLIVLIFVGILQAMRTYMVEIMQRRLFARISAQVMHTLLRVRKDAFDSAHGPELVNRFFDIVTVQKAAALLLIDGLALVTATLIGMILMAFYHPYLLVFDILLLLAIAFTMWPLGRGAIPTAIAESKMKYTVAAWLEELARNTVTFKSKAGLAYAFSRTDSLVTEWTFKRKKHFRILFKQVLGSLTIQAIASAVLLGFGGWLVIERQLTLGQLVAAELIVTLVVSNFAKFGKQLETFYDLTAASDKVGHLLDLPVESSGPEMPPSPSTPASISVRDVSYGYASREKVLDNVSFEVAPGQRVGILGFGSSGKSTLVDLLYGLRNPKAGYIALDGADYRQLNLKELRGQIALVRDVEVFDGSIADNVRLGNPEVSNDEIRRVLQQVGIFDAVMSMPEGMDTQLMTGGRPLSPRQAVALMIARAIVMQPRVLIVDEDFVALDDSDCAADLVKVLSDLEQPWTLLLIAHASSIRQIAGHCEVLYFVENGQVGRVSDADYQRLMG
ncbi:MAG: ATP-binding cassette domain-containing protein [Bryobacterales bacterium]|nr:ATP-binding cassette domain-containing protein [Bryobacterales bacterium]